jgi:hypothetical protein
VLPSFEYRIMEFVAAIMLGIKADVFEIGIGNTEKTIRASRDELDANFEVINSKRQ